MTNDKFECEKEKSDYLIVKGFDGFVCIDCYSSMGEPPIIHLSEEKAKKLALKLLAEVSVFDE